MLAECEQIFTLPDGSQIKVVMQLLTTHRGVGAQVEYTAIYFVSTDGSFWSNLPGDVAKYCVTDEQLKQVKVKLWKMLEPV